MVFLVKSVYFFGKSFLFILYFTTGTKINNRVLALPEDSEDENLSDDDEYHLPKLTIPETDSESDSEAMESEVIYLEETEPTEENTEEIYDNKEMFEDGIGHWPSWANDRQRCKNCGQKSHVYCSKCRCYFCFNKDRNCFKNFHVLTNE